MIRFVGVQEWRIVVPGRAWSFRSPNAFRYRAAVRRAARAVFRRRPLSVRCEVRLDYFFSGARRMDMDNVAKCVLDALTGVVYRDDVQVALQFARGHDLSRVVHVPDETVDLVKPLRLFNEYVFVRVRPNASRRNAE
jgi:Holliday junction resolvase RusA-like endonuclease